MKGPAQFWKSVKRDLKSKKASRNATRFIVVFSLVFLFLLYVAIPLTSGLWDNLGAWHAQSVSGLLSSVWDIESAVDGNILTMEVQGQEVDFLISQLCSGDVEIALLVALLIASFDILLAWRVLGAIVGAVFLILMNPVRIAVTLVITKGSGLEAGDFYHTLIFRLFLFVVLIMYYFAWYRAFANRECNWNILWRKICKKT
jgi:exosortase/archaeosortase family protein